MHHVDGFSAELKAQHPCGIHPPSREILSLDEPCPKDVAGLANACRQPRAFPAVRRHLTFDTCARSSSGSWRLSPGFASTGRMLPSRHPVDQCGISTQTMFPNLCRAAAHFGGWDHVRHPVSFVVKSDTDRPTRIGCSIIQSTHPWRPPPG